MSLQYKCRLVIKKSIYKQIFEDKIDSIEIDDSCLLDYRDLNVKYKRSLHLLALPKHIIYDLLFKTPLFNLNPKAFPTFEKGPSGFNVNKFIFNDNEDFYDKLEDLYISNNYLLYRDEMVNYCNLISTPDYLVIKNSYCDNIDFRNKNKFGLVIKTKCLCISAWTGIIYKTRIKRSSEALFKEISSDLLGALFFKGEECKNLKTIFNLLERIDFCGSVNDCTGISVKTIYDKKIIFLHTNPESG
uniref:Uncharacterized protein n=1 Tax=viral metagenome TaxID=1070528 RepID=A0A6C0JPX3_9ZZZZ